VYEGVQPDFVVGASVGAMNAAYFAGAPNAEGVARLAEIWFGLRRREIFPVTFKSAFGLLRHPESVIDSGGLRHLIEDNLAYARLEDATVPVHITATSVEGLTIVLSKGPAIDAILASAAIPGIFPPRRFAAGTELAPRLPRRSWPGFRGWDRRGFRQAVMNLPVSRTVAPTPLTPSDTSHFFQNKK
jgi:predicted acylesterase/phospholipase RssA